MTLAGDLRERVTIQVKTTVRDAQGGAVVTWATLDATGANPATELPAAVVPLTSRERLDAQAVGSAVQYHVTIRRRTDVTADMRLQWTPSYDDDAGTQTLEIAGVRPVDWQWVELDCGELN